MNECDSCMEKAKYELNAKIFCLPCLVDELDQTGIGSTTDLAILFAVQEDEEEYQELIINTINDINEEYDVEIKILENEVKPRYLLEKNNVCYGCQFYEPGEENDCTSARLCINGNVNDYRVGDEDD